MPPGYNLIKECVSGLLAMARVERIESV